MGFTFGTGFRPEIQGLRAIAVGLVLVYHIWPEALPGGFVGVDVFFVISGFLITRLLINEAAQTGTVSISSFWARRIRRLMPATTVVLVAVLWLSIHVLPSTAWLGVAREILAASVYLVNWLLAVRAEEYAERGSDPSPVQHFWSLSIEEQFYIAWPVLVLMAVRIFTNHPRRALLISTAGAFILSLAYSIYLTYTGSPAAYFSTLTRIWELALGCFVAAALVRPGVITARLRLGPLLSWGGLFMIGWSAWTFSTHGPFPGWIALVPTLGATLVIVAGATSPWSAAGFLSLKGLQYIGDISYSLYLWHWPVVVFWPLIIGQLGLPEPWAQGAIQVLVSLLLGIMGKHLVEDPFRHGKLFRWMQLHRRLPSFAIGYLLVSVTVFVSARRAHLEVEALNRAETEREALFAADPKYPGAAAMDPNRPSAAKIQAPFKPQPRAARRDRSIVYKDGCDARQNNGSVSICYYGKPGGAKTIALFGDSHATHFLPALRKLANKHQWELIVLQKTACLPSNAVLRMRTTGKVNTDCEGWKRKALKLLIKSHPNLVITSGARPDIYSWYRVPPNDQIVAGYQDLWTQLTDQNIPVLVVRDIPRMVVDVPACLAKAKKKTNCDRSRRYALERRPDPLLAAVAEQSHNRHLYWADFTPFFCSEQTCPAVIGNLVVYRDGDHLTNTFSRTMAPYLGDQIRSILGRN